MIIEFIKIVAMLSIIVYIFLQIWIRRNKKRKIMLIFGSGGHTTELLLISK